MFKFLASVLFVLCLTFSGQSFAKDMGSKSLGSPASAAVDDDMEGGHCKEKMKNMHKQCKKCKEGDGKSAVCEKCQKMHDKMSKKEFSCQDCKCDCQSKDSCSCSSCKGCSPKHEDEMMMQAK